MAEAATLIPHALAPVIVGSITATIGIMVEKHFVNRRTIIVNAFSLVVIWATIPLISTNFWIASPFFIIGLIAITTDVRKKAKKGWVAFLLGSKTLGALSIYVASSELGWAQYFDPLVKSIKGAGSTVATGEAQAMAFIAIFGVVHLLGVIAWVISRLKQKGFIHTRSFQK